MMTIAALLRTHSKICCTRSRRYFNVTPASTGIRYLHNNRDNHNHGDLPPPDNGLLKVLNGLGLDKYIVPLSDLGYFSLTKTTTSEIEEATNDESSSSPCCPIINDIKKNIDLNKKPSVVTPDHIRETNLNLPRQFSFSGNNAPPPPPVAPSSSLFHYKFWLKLVSLYVAVTERNLNLEEDIDFVFGGFILYFLATGKLSDDIPNANEKCIMTKIPGTDAVVINRHKIYKTNPNSIGSQLERIVCGGGIDDNKDNNINPYSNFVTHLHLVDIAGVKVLMSTEIDALFSPEENINSIPLEIKSVTYTKSYNRQEPILFQMISSASQYICEGLTRLDDNGRKILCNLRIRSLMEYSLRPNIISKRKLIQHGEIIRDSIEGLQKLCKVMEEGEVYELKYDKEIAGNLTMISSATITIDDLFPKKKLYRNCCLENNCVQKVVCFIIPRYIRTRT